MKKLLKQMQLLFGNAPTVSSFETQLQTLDEALRTEHRYNLCRLAFGYYDSLPGPFRSFIDHYLTHDRYLYVDYLIHHTALLGLRYPLHAPELFLSMLHVLENADRRGRIPYHHLSSCLLLVFDYPYTLNTLGDTLRRATPNAETLCDFLFLMGLVQVEGEQRANRV